MPQFDTFSFFSQLFWVFIGFNFLYLTLCFFILPAIATTLKIRAKKLTQTTANSSLTSSVISTQISDLTFFESISLKLNSIASVRVNLNNDINLAYLFFTFKQDAFNQFNFFVLNQVKTITLFFVKK